MSLTFAGFGPYAGKYTSDRVADFLNKGYFALHSVIEYLNADSQTGL